MTPHTSSSRSVSLTGISAACGSLDRQFGAHQHLVNEPHERSVIRESRLGREPIRPRYHSSIIPLDSTVSIDNE